MMGDYDSRLRRLVLPSSAFKACCDTPLTEAQKGLAKKLGGIVGSSYVKENYTQKGSRLGKGTALCYCQPATMSEAIKALQACVDADVAVIPQGANTSLTGGSVPHDTRMDRPTVILNLRRLTKILPIGEDTKQVLCFSGAGIYDLKTLMESKGRESHSVLGSIFLNPSVAAGVAFGSGGTQIRKGPSWTERALYCKVNKDGKVELVNTLGLKDGGDPCGFLEKTNELKPDDFDPKCKAPASWPKYGESIRKIDDKVSRYNADCTGLECCRSEGKVMILATIHDTYEPPKKIKTLWISCKDFQMVHDLKKEVCLKSADTMAKSCEYMNKEVVDGVNAAGRILIKMIDIVGMQRLEPLWNLKLMIEMIPLPFTGIICDKFLWWFNGIVPRPLPTQLEALTQEFTHHCLTEFADYSEGESDRLMAELEKFIAKQPKGSIKYQICEGADAQRAVLFRFVVAPAFRTFAIGKGLQGLSIDYALPKNYTQYPPLPEKEYPIENRWMYSHFGCNVFHEDLTFLPKVDVEVGRFEIKHAVDHVGGKLPAEHGHGTEYPAPKDMQQRWMETDPLNVMNPGVGGTSCFKEYRAAPGHLHSGACCGHAH